MKKQNKLSIKVRDLEPLKDVIGGRIGSPLPGETGRDRPSRPSRRLRTSHDSVTNSDRAASWDRTMMRFLIVRGCRENHG
jgi:hypothetical protein